MEVTAPIVVVTSPRFWGTEDSGMKLLRERGFEPIYHPNFDVPDQCRELVRAVVLADQICSAEQMARFPNLRIIARTGTGYDNVDLDAARKRNIVVTRISQLNAGAVSELIVGLILCLTRNILLSQNCLVYEDQWDKARKPGRSLSELAVGIVGLGAIGRALATKLHSLKTKEIIGWNRTARKEISDVAINNHIRLTDLDNLMIDSDLVAVCLALQKGEGGTEDIISREKLGRMKHGALLVNASRGEVVDEEALAENVMLGKIGGVALDVYSEEPPFKKPYFKTLKAEAGRMNILLTPHIGAVTQSSDRDMSLVVAQNIISALDYKLEGLEIVS
jgi:D-3-phosphoglycerate dehydrogenase / 2-oxoglutarate reductase